MDRPFPTYQGDEPYVFVSYSHDDEKEVFGEIRWLKDQGINVYYDVGIRPGKEWSDELAHAIKGCSQFLYFVTPKAVESENCRRELNFALAENRRVLAVHLRQTDVPDGIRLNLDNRQALFKYALSNESYRSALLTTLDQPDATQRVKPRYSLRRLPVKTIASLGIALIAAFYVYQFVMQPGSTETLEPIVDLSKRVSESAVPVSALESKAFGPAASGTGHLSLAVLPFDNLSPDKSTEYFSDGMTAELINKLSRLEGLDVVSRWSVMEFKAKSVSVQDVAVQLGVRYVLTGGVRKEGHLIRMNVELTDATTGFNLWSDDFDGNLSDVWTFQEASALRIVDALGLQLSMLEVEAVHRRYTENAEAYDAYLHGWALMDTLAGGGDDRATLDAARMHFQRAITFDANFALAITGLAQVESGMWFFGVDRSDKRLASAEDLANRALSLDPGLSEAHTALGDIRTMEGDPASGIIEFQEAIRLDPNNAYAWEELAWALLALDPPEAEEAEQAARAAIRLKPGFFWSYHQLARALRDQNRLDKAIAVAEQSMLLRPDFRSGLILLGRLHLAQGDYNQALIRLQAARQQNDTPGILFLISVTYAGLGEEERALAELKIAVKAGFDLASIDESTLARANPLFQEIIRRER